MNRHLISLAALAAAFVFAADEPSPEDIPVPMPDVRPVIVEPVIVEPVIVPPVEVELPVVRLPEVRVLDIATAIVRVGEGGVIEVRYVNVPPESVPVPSVCTEIVLPCGANAADALPAGVAVPDSLEALVPPAADGASRVSCVDIPVVNVAAASVYDPNVYVRRVIELQGIVARLFADKRMSAHDSGVSPRNEAFSAWLSIYREFKGTGLKPVPFSGKGIRMIAEARVPGSPDKWASLASGLDMYRGLGYNAVLVALRGTDTADGVSMLADEIRSRGMSVWLAWSGEESLTATLFDSPERMRSLIGAAARKADAMLLGWRRTSVHLFLMDPAYADFIASAARAANPGIVIFGEGYYGQTAASDGRTDALTYNMPPYVSGCCVSGIGYARANLEYALGALFGSVASMPRLAVVVGDRPYYATRNRNRLTAAENRAVKRRLEDAFVKAGCIGTITLHGDGSDGLYDKDVTDNICDPVR